MTTTFRKLTSDWNAEPNAPDPMVERCGSKVVLRFRLNPFIYDFKDDQEGEVVFHGCWRSGFSTVNDEGFYRGQCRFSGVAPKWGEFYEVTGDLRLDRARVEWNTIGTPSAGSRHFLFYFRDSTFEADAQDFTFRPLPTAAS